MSGHVTHLKRGNGGLKALDVLIKILSEKKLVGSTNKRFVRGELSAVCFQDAPLHGLAQKRRWLNEG
ncbi:hypothetical protein [Halobacillus salinus]|uniref:hypothetical protein n=1 Tax=Halobacillus salinus TaxID=192814 RepID=UPI00107EE572|nr:hypothetical protein [Halobacillus salinus]